jgi:hypothetical protein
VKTRGGDGGAEGVRCSAEWWEQSWQDMVGDVRIDGASSRSCSSRQKVEGLGVVERQWGSSDVQRWWRSAGGEDSVVEEKA